ncbi:ATP-binding protein [Flavobacterium lacus]|uniref:Rad50/SbcC-type AAA domain-containing protein n=1 Tax=Flavobacterium lacus TaxID=1353778 RepID=A0A328WQX7_9FLAO|nr:ATP-binding protein [Flavobacterium lacus]RAR46807.1 hypothetical protein B0I10_11423 [Flavobacterium lacus]
MSNSSFIFSELRLTGEGINNASIQFNSGLNIITGPTNTGKSYIFQCINYMLGSTERPKNITQAKRYKHIFLEIQDYQNQYYTLKSDLVGGNFQLYNCKIDKITPDIQSRFLDRKHSSLNQDNISAFLLSLNNIQEKQIRLNAQGKKRNLSYRDVKRFLMVNEERIITQQSPIVSHFTNRTEELNTLKFLITGKDDSQIEMLLTANEITHRKGKIELLSELIRDSENTYQDKTSLDEINISLKSLKETSDSISEKFTKLKNEYLEIENVHSDKLFYIQELQGSFSILDELLKRSHILEQQYRIDTERLKATIEASVLLGNNSTQISKCPLCENEVKHECNEQEILEIIKSCEAEIIKIEKLQKELNQSSKLIREEIEEIEIKILKAELEIEKIKSNLNNGIGKEIQDIIEILREISDRRSYLLGLKDNTEKVLNYKNQKSLIEQSIPKKKDKIDFEKFTTSTATSLCKNIKNVLNQINYHCKSVEYSEFTEDFVFDGEERGLSGKGYRAITFAAFILGLQEHIKSKDYGMGVPVLDSPFVTYRKPKAGDEAISVDLAMDFYRYAAKSVSTQFIIIENEEPPLDIENEVNHIIFTGVVGSGRYGFIPDNLSSMKNS